MNHSHAIVQFFEENFNEKKCHDLSRQYKFIERSTSTLKGYEFIKTMIIPSEGLSTDGLKGLCKRMNDLNPEATLSAQALCGRINDISSSRLMKGILAEILEKIHKKIKSSCPKLAIGLDRFNRVLLQDSTVAVLNEKLGEIYKGTRRGNNCVKAQVKIDLIHDLNKGLLVDASLFRGNEPDQGLAGRLTNFIEANDLIIRDLGYFAISAFQTIAQNNAYFLSRLKSGVHFYLDELDEIPLDLAEHLKKKEFKHLNIIEFKGYLGKEKIQTRLIIYRQSQELTDQRLRDANKQARKKGETISKNRKLLLSFSVFVTNAPEDMISAGFVGTVYRLRWEIELVFKRWKSQLEIDYLKGIHKERIDCLIWSRLCTVVILELIIGYFKTITEKLNAVELSEVKTIQYLMRSNSFSLAMAQNKLEAFFAQMEKDVLRMLLKDKRSRKTMREKVLHKENYYDIQVTDNECFA